jgi:ribosome recycling factor
VIDQTLRDADSKMDKAVEHTREEFAAIRTGRAHPAMFAQITAEYYGQQTPLNQLAGFQVPEPRTVIIQPYDAGAKPAIEKAIRDSDLGVNPSDDGKVLRVTLPELTEDRRKEYIKLHRGARCPAQRQAGDGQGREGLRDQQGRQHRRGEAARRLDQEARRDDRRDAQEQRSRTP